MSTPARTSLADKALTVLVTFCALATGPIVAASAMPLGVGTVRTGPPPMSHSLSPAINNLGGGLNNQVDFYAGHGGSVQPSNFSDCPRRVMDRLPKGARSTTARRRCGGP